MSQTSEGKIKRQLDNWIKNNWPNAFRFRVPGGPFGQIGMGDYIVIWLGTPIMIEVKADASKKATDLQMKQLLKFQESGGISCLLKGFQEFKLRAITKECEIRHLRRVLNTPDSGDHAGSSEYGIWYRIKQRAKDLGIELDDDWAGDISAFRAFYDHIGPRPTMMHTVDRVDPTRGYVTGNVRWADKEIQGNNKINSVTYVIDGKSGTLSQLARMYDLSPAKVYFRHKVYGWDLRRALTTR